MAKLTREQKAAAYKALPVALIQRPLRFIKNRTMVADVVEPGEKQTFSVSKEYLYARKAADFGFGDIVQHIAMKVNQGATA